MMPRLCNIEQVIKSLKFTPLSLKVSRMSKYMIKSGVYRATYSTSLVLYSFVIST